MKKLNVIIVIEKGVMRTPFVTKSDNVASAFYENVARELLGDDFDDIVRGFFDDFSYDRISKYLKSFGSEIQWFTDIKINQ